MERTVSVANVIALTETNNGCTTFSSSISEIVPLRTLIPAETSPFACLFLNSVTVCIGFKPAFSARVKGITSSEFAKPLRHIASNPSHLSAKAANFSANSISGAPPPAIKAFFRTKQRTTHSAS